MDEHCNVLTAVAGSVVLLLAVFIYRQTDGSTQGAPDNASPLNTTATPAEYYTTLDGMPFATEAIMTVFETPILPAVTLPITSELQAEIYIQEYLSTFIPDLEWCRIETRRINEATLTLLDSASIPTAVVTVDPTHHESEMWNRPYWISAFEAREPFKMPVFQDAFGPDFDAPSNDAAFLRSAYVLFYDSGQIAGSGLIESEDMEGNVFAHEAWTLTDLSALTSLSYP